MSTLVSMPLSTRTVLLVPVVAALCGCAVGPDYQPPKDQAPAAWQAPLPHQGDAAAMAQWWQQFNDPVLAQLIERAEADSPTLIKAWANIEKSRAALSSSAAAGWPGVNASGAITRARQQQTTPQAVTSTTRSAGLDASWELDLFGKLRRNNQAARARVDARIDDWHDARVSLAAEVADNYVQYRACLLLSAAYQRELESVSLTAKTTAVAVQAGFNPPAEAALARASVASTRSSWVLQTAQCELLVKSLVALTGVDESALRASFAQSPAGIPQPQALEVPTVPAEVLRQRPDLASLERELAASSAGIGASKAALFPSLSLSGAIGASALSGAASVTTWSFGPALVVPLFEGGRRRAALHDAKASYLAALASYQQGVRNAVKEVEQALINLDSSARRSEDAAAAAAEYRRYLDATQANWQAGNVSLLTLEDARRTALSADISLLTLEQNRVQQWIALYKALGGGWQTGMAASSPSNEILQGGGL